MRFLKNIFRGLCFHWRFEPGAILTGYALECDGWLVQKAVEAEKVGDGIGLMRSEVVDGIADYDVVEPVLPFAEWVLQPTFAIVKIILP